MKDKKNLLGWQWLAGLACFWWAVATSGCLISKLPPSAETESPLAGEPSSARLLKTFARPESEAHYGFIQSMTIDAKGNLYVSDDSSLTIQKYGPDGHFVKEWQISDVDQNKNPGRHGPRSLTVTSQGVLCMIAGLGRILKYDAETGKPVGEVTPFPIPGRPNSFEFFLNVAALPDGRLLTLVQHENQSNLVWLDAGTGKELKRVANPVPPKTDAGELMLGSQTELTTDEKGQSYLLCTADSSIRCFDLAGNLLHTFRSNQEKIGGEALTDVGLAVTQGRIYTTGGSLKVFDLAGKQLRKLAFKTGFTSDCVAADPQGDVYFTNHSRRQVIYRIRVGDLVRETDLPGETVYNMRFLGETSTYTSDQYSAARFSSDGTFVLAARQSGELSWWNLGSQQMIWQAASRSKVKWLGLSSDNQRAVVKSVGTRSADTELTVWDVTQGKQMKELTTRSNALLFVPGTHHLLSAEFGGVQEIDVDTGQTVRTLAAGNPAYSLGISRAGDRLVVGLLSTTLLLEVQSGTVLKTIQNPFSVEQCTLSPDGKTILWSGRNGELQLYDLEGNRKIHDLKGAAANLTHLDFSGDGKQAVTSSTSTFERTIRVWNLVEGREVSHYTFEASTSRGPNSEFVVGSSVFSPDGKSVLFTTGQISIWDLTQTGEEKK